MDMDLMSLKWEPDLLCVCTHPMVCHDWGEGGGGAVECQGIDKGCECRDFRAVSDPRWRLYNAEVDGLSVDDAGVAGPGLCEILLGSCTGPLKESITGDFALSGTNVTLQLVAVWDHEPSDAERDAAKPEDYRDEDDGCPICDGGTGTACSAHFL